MAQETYETKQKGRPTPKKVTITLAAHHAEEIDKMAAEAKISRAALCAHIIERYAMQDREVMTNDVIAQRLEQTLQSYFRQFDERFSRLFMRQLHESIAIRSQLVAEAKEQYGIERGNALREISWQAAIHAIKPHLERTAIEDYNGADTMKMPASHAENELRRQQALAAQQAAQVQYLQQPAQPQYAPQPQPQYTPHTEETEKQ